MEVLKMNKYKKLGKNTLLMTLGNFGTKVLSFLLLPFYTKYMTPKLYGELNLITAILSFLTPILTLEFTAAIFRFISGEEEDEKNKVLSTALIFVFPLLMVGLLLLGSLSKYFNLEYIVNYHKLITTSFISGFILGVFKEYIRAEQNIKLYTISGILVSLITLISNILLVPRYSLKGFLISGILANTLVVIYLFFKEKFHVKIKISNFNFTYIKTLSSYSLPLIPNAVIWWIIGLSDRFIIDYYHVSDMVGVYSVANKFSLLLTTLFGFFYKSLQVSALEEYKSEEYCEFFNNIFLTVSSILLLFIIGLALVINPIMKIAVSNEFYISWVYVIPLLLATLYNNYSAMLGINYLATKQSKKLLKSSVIAALVNIIFNIILIPKYEIWGAIISTVLAYLILFFIRYKDSFNNIKLKLGIKFYLANLIPIVMCLFLLLNISFVTRYTVLLSLTLLFLIIEKEKILYRILTLNKK